MRFMSIVTSPQSDKGPTPALMEAMGKLAEREIKAGRMVDMGGLTPLQEGARVLIEGGKLRVTDGPFVEAKEVIGGYAIFEFRDKAEALAMAREFMQLHLTTCPAGKAPASYAPWPVTAWKRLAENSIPRPRLMRAFARRSRRR